MPRRKTDYENLLPPSGTNTKYRVRVFVPKELYNRVHLLPHPYTDKTVLIKTTGTGDKAIAKKVRGSITDDFHRMIEAIRPIPHEWVKLAEPPRVAAVDRDFPWYPENAARLLSIIEMAQPGVPWAVKHPDSDGLWQARTSDQPAEMIDATPEPAKRCALNTALDSWETHRYDLKKKSVRPQQKINARRDKELVFEKLFAWGGAKRKPDPTDMASYTNDDMVAYQVHLAKLGGSIAFDHWSHIAALFGRAKQYKLITVDPTEGIEQPNRVQRVEPPFSPDEQRRILRAALRSRKPAVKFGTLLSKFTGSNNSECFESMADEFIYVNGVLCWDLRARVLKDSGAGTRGRLTPIHPAVLAAGFEEYLAARKGKKLFEGSPNVHSSDVNALVHNPDAGPRIDKRFKSWRKSFTDPITRLSGKLLGNTMIGEYLSGHRPTGIHASFYMFHTEPEGFADLVTVIHALDDPLKEIEMAA